MIRRIKITRLAGVVVLAIAGVGTVISFGQNSDPPSPTPSPPDSSYNSPTPTQGDFPTGPTYS